MSLQFGYLGPMILRMKEPSLEDDAAAFAYACQLARELAQNVARADPSMLIKVMDDSPRDRLFNIALRGLRLTLPLFNDKALVLALRSTT